VLAPPRTSSTQRGGAPPSVSQFESYRALGLHAITQIAGGFRGGDLPAFFRAVDGYLKERAPAK